MPTDCHKKSAQMSLSKKKQQLLRHELNGGDEREKRHELSARE